VGFAGVVDEAEELDTLLFEQRFEADDGFVDGVMAGECLDAFVHESAIPFNDIDKVYAHGCPEAVDFVRRQTGFFAVLKYQ